MGERFGPEPARVVNQRAPGAEVSERPIDQTPAGLRGGDIAGHGEHAGLAGAGDAPRVRDDRVPELAVGLHDPGADALRRAGDDRDIGARSCRLSHLSTMARQPPAPPRPAFSLLVCRTSHCATIALWSAGNR